MEASVKDSECTRRCHSKPIEISSLTRETPLPVDMSSFWPSNMNKTNFQQLLRECILRESPARCSGVEIVVSGVSGDTPLPCQSHHQGRVNSHTDLDVTLEEADMRLIPHAMHATINGTSRVVILSTDTDVLVVCLYFWHIFHSHGLKELWMRAGVRNTTRYIPVHTLGDKDPDLCKVLPAVHALTGCDSTNKFASMKSKPVSYLAQFG